MAMENDPSQAPEQEAGEKAKTAALPEREDPTTLHERTIAALSYFSFLAIVPFYLKKDSEFCRFHGKQGLLLAIIFFLFRVFMVIDLIADIFLLFQGIAVFVFGFSALSGRWRRLPFVYNWACQLEDSLSLKTKEEEAEAEALGPNQLKGEKEATEAVAPATPETPQPSNEDQSQ